jgi:hypothetical protein
MAVPWTEEMQALAKQLWVEGGLSAAQIGLKIGKTRSAVCGQMHRMGLSKVDPIPGVKRSTPVRVRVQGLLRKQAAKPKKVSVSHADRDAAMQLEPTGGHAALEPPGRCLFLRLDDEHCCGRPIMQGRSWCDAHRAVVFKSRTAA